MKPTKRTLLTIASAGALAFASNAFAADTTTMVIVTSITATCKFVNPTPAMNFGALDPSATTDAVQTVNIGYKCSNGTPASSITINGGTSSTTTSLGQVGGTGTLPVHLVWTTPATAGSGFASTTPPITFGITGTIAAADINGAMVGTYIFRQPISILP